MLDLRNLGLLYLLGGFSEVGLVPYCFVSLIDLVLEALDEN